MWLFIAILIHIIGHVKSFCSAKRKLKDAKIPPQEKIKGKHYLEEINSSVFLSFVVSCLFRVSPVRYT